VLFTITSQTGGLDAAQVAVRDLRTGAQKVLLRGGSHGHYVASGHLVYVAAGTLRAISFDPNRLETHGTAVPVLPRLATTSFGAGDFAGQKRHAFYVNVPAASGGCADACLGRSHGQRGTRRRAAARTRSIRVSPDGTRVALSASIRRPTSGSGTWDGRR
jgi:hypothetical protein